MIEKIKKCKNKCIFCFIDQLPENLRSSLYIKDDDFLESFKHGNFITLTNLNKKDIDNIIKYSLSPLYVSFHSADEKIRKYIFGTEKQSKSIELLKILDSENIKTNIQIVLCPGINDNGDLINTLDFLDINLKNIFSTGIVPVGITKFNKNPDIISFNEENSMKLIESIDKYKEKKRKNNIFLSDEFYIMAKINFPEYEFYGSFPQIENGVGLCRNFIHDINTFFMNANKKKKNIFEENKLTYSDEPLKNIYDYENNNKNMKKNILILTSEYFYETMSGCAGAIKAFINENNLDLNLNIKVEDVKNKFLGGNVKVAGLLTYYDFINTFNNNTVFKQKEINTYDKILISNNIFNNEGLTLDNKTEKDFKDICANIKFVNPDGKSLLKEIFNI
ncbi:DUF512 domain-containing protein [bacterium]|nr:DUF512 domain-containing protein [bacterium]